MFLHDSVLQPELSRGCVRQKPTAPLGIPSSMGFLYGSRVDDGARGGDIDVLVISKRIDLMEKLGILGELHEQLGDQRIDLSIVADLSAPFSRVARASGVAL